MNPEVTLKIEAIDNTKQALSSVKRNLAGVENSTTSLKDRLKALEPTFKRMAVVGAAAFGAITAGVLKATQEAAIAEGSWNKFNTVFGDGADEMRDFITAIRSEMPTATHEIARMAADLQDLLIPMGIARGEAQTMTQGFIDLANKVAAFNDVDPTEVLEAIKSGLAGSSEPLRRFGINALESSLELEALNSGLLDAGQKFTDLDPILRSQVRAQALLTLSVKQSSDAINGFEANNDSLMRRQQELSATMKELSKTLGDAFIPVLDEALKAVMPVIKVVADWVKQNPELAKNILIAAAALAGLVSVVATLSLLLLALNPISIMIMGVFAALGAAFVGVNNTLKLFGLTWSDVWEAAKQTFKSFANYFIDIADGIANTWVAAVNGIISALNSIKISIPDWVPKYGGRSFSIDLPKVPELKIPRLAEGGIVTRSTLANIGEAGPEAVIPLDRLGKMGGDTYNLYISGTFLNDREAAKRIGNEVMRQFGRDARVPSS